MDERVLAHVMREVEAGTADAIFEAPKCDYTKELIGAAMLTQQQMMETA